MRMASHERVRNHNVLGKRSQDRNPRPHPRFRSFDGRSVSSRTLLRTDSLTAEAYPARPIRRTCLAPCIAGVHTERAATSRASAIPNRVRIPPPLPLNA